MLIRISRVMAIALLISMPSRRGMAKSLAGGHCGDTVDNVRSLASAPNGDVWAGMYSASGGGLLAMMDSVPGLRPESASATPGRGELTAKAGRISPTYPP